MKKKNNCDPTIILDTHCGDRITDTIKEAISTAKDEATAVLIATLELGLPAIRGPRLVEFNFNGVTVIVRSNSNPDHVYRDWNRALLGYINKTVGPDYKAELSAEELESDAKIEAEQQVRCAEQRARQQAEEDAKRAKFDAKLAKAPEMSFIDRAGWDEWLANQDGSSYGEGAFHYAEWWARLMELELKKGKQIKDIAERTSHEANVEGITGFMHSCAVAILEKCWKYGEELRHWYDHRA